MQTKQQYSARCNKRFKAVESLSVFNMYMYLADLELDLEIIEIVKLIHIIS